ncbi:MAG: chemotaxis protein CheA [Candidatus Kariarchaeaceae archaeon]|jgi:two-component system chemotaxis sensor kinase CheA
MSEYKDIFLAELEENISLLNTTLLQVEKDASSPSLVKDLVRAAHTIKGMAATMGYTTLTKLTHEIESHLQSINVVSPNLIQTLFKAADRLQRFYDTVEKQKDPETINVDDLLSELRIGVTPTVRSSMVSPADELRLGTSYKIVIKFESGTRLIGARGFQAYSVIDSLAEITSSDPPVEILDEGKLVGDIDMEIISYETEYEIKQALSSVEDISEIILTNLMEDTVPALTGPTFRRVVQSVRVNLDRLDRVIDLLGELVITRGRFQSLIDRITPEISEQLQIFDNTVTTIQDTVMGFRMVSLSHIFDTYPRAVRDIAHSRGMTIDLILQGTHIQIDRSVVDQVNEALLHLVRNAAVHGIEEERDRTRAGKPKSGSIRLAARRERGEVVFEVEDDGAGLDIEEIRSKGVSMGLITEATVMSRSQLATLIFKPGFSTAKEITEIAGRGVGMDIVKSTIDEISGTIEIRTKSGAGTRFVIRVPQTLAIIEGLVVQVGSGEFVIPLLNVEKIFSIRDPAVELHEERQYLNWEGHNVRIVDLRDHLADFLESNGPETPPVTEKRRFKAKESREKVILWERAGKRVGLRVTKVLEQREIVTKQLDDVYRQLKRFSGATILGYDQVALIIDPDSIELVD